MADTKKSETTNSSIDVGAASMAYMPGANGKSEAEASESELSIDKKSEKHTMADIAAELEAEDKAATAAVKVPIGGKPVPVAATSEKSKPVKVAEKVEPKDTPLLIHGMTKNTSDDAFDDELTANEDDHKVIEAESHTARSDTAGRGGKARLVLGLLLVLAVIGAGAFGWLWYQGQTKVTDLQSQVSDLKTAKSSLQDRLDANASATPSPAAAATTATGTRTIPEIGLSYKLSDATKKVTYEYSETTGSDKSVHSVLKFSSTDLVGAERKVVTDASKYTCLANNGPLGSITSFKATDTLSSGAKASTLKIDSETNFKIGETYYVYAPSQSTCSTDKTVQASQTAGKALVVELVKSLAVTK